MKRLLTLFRLYRYEFRRLNDRLTLEHTLVETFAGVNVSLCGDWIVWVGCFTDYRILSRWKDKGAATRSAMLCESRRHREAVKDKERESVKS